MLLALTPTCTHRKESMGPQPRKRLRPRTPRPIAVEIEELLRPIRDLFALLAEADNPEGYEEAVFLVRTASMRWATMLNNSAELEEPNDLSEDAAQKLTELITVSQSLGRILAGLPVTGKSFAPFWSTPLGQLIFANNGFPKRPSTINEAAAVLGLRRQAVEYLLRNPGSSKLEKVADSNPTLITRRSLYHEFVRRSVIERAQKYYPPGKAERFDQ